MWPERGEALNRTIQAEQAIEDLYAEALRRWAPELSAAVLPTLGAVTAAADDPQPQQQQLPADPAAVEQTSDGWSTATEIVIIAGIGLLWSAAVIEAMDALGIPLPSVDGQQTGPGEVSVPLPVFDPAVLRIVDSAVGDMDAAQVEHAHLVVEASPVLRETRNAFQEQQRQRAAETPAIVQAKVESAVQVMAAGTVDDRREAAAAAIDPAGPTMRDVARNQGYQAASVLNHAVLTAAEQSSAEFDEALDKCWIATLDGKTRPTHWAADGQRVPLAASFTVGGEQMLYPADPAASAAEAANCRCRLGILAKDEQLPDEVDRHTERLDGRDSVVVNRDGRTQAEEITRRRQAGNVRARDDQDGIGRVAAVSEQENEMTEQVAELIGNPDTLPERFEPDPDFASAIAALVAANQVDDGPRLRAYDPRLFEDPKLTGPTAPTMNNETGRIYGHLAEWGTVIRGGRDATPRNRNGYRNFHTGQVQLDNGRQLSVGRLTVQGGHASTEPGVTTAAARAHYDDVTTAFGLVRVGEDRFGIWFSGVPYPGVDPDVFQQGMVTQLSGDWRDCPGHPLDMIAAHAVNTQGFPIYSAMTGPDGREMALVASLGPVRRSAPAAPLTVDEVKVAMAEVLADERRASDLAARRDAALTAAQAAVGEPPAPLTPAERIGVLTAAHSAMPAQFKAYWLHGAGAAQIRFGTPGDFDRCRKAINAKIVEKGKAPLPPHEIDGLCASLHKEATGATPGHAPGESKG